MQSVFYCPNERLLAYVFNKVRSMMDVRREKEKKKLTTGVTKGETKTDKIAQSAGGLTC